MMHIENNLPNPLFHIGLFEPEIPNNTGNIGRLCVGLNSHLHIIGQPAFEITDKRVKRAGLDYWDDLTLRRHVSWESYISQVSNIKRVFLFSTKAKKSLFDVTLQSGDHFIFGKETRGLPDEMLSDFEEQVIGLPMLGPIRSQNLANTVSVAMYEGLRQVAQGGSLDTKIT